MLVYTEGLGSNVFRFAHLEKFLLKQMFINVYIDLFFSLKLECEKLASEKTEMQRHYVMVRSV